MDEDRESARTMTGRPPTIRDVAREAGVAVGTASKALNGQGKLREETRERVRAAAQRLEFRPNDLMKSLLRGRSYTVGLLTSDIDGRFSTPLLIGIEGALEAAEMLVFLRINRDDDREQERRDIEALLARQVDGIIVMGNKTGPREPISLGRANVPMVYVMNYVDAPGVLSLTPEEIGGGRLVTEHLLRFGRRRLAYISGPSDHEAVWSRRVGMREVLAANGLELPDERVFESSWSEPWGYDAVGMLLEHDPTVDGIFCGNDIIARGVIDGLKDRGRRVPEDVAVAGFDNWEPFASGGRPPLTTGSLNLTELGRAAVMKLLERINGSEEAGIIRLPCSLVVRSSCGEMVS
jgi:LacI family transcriptional regulator